MKDRLKKQEDELLEMKNKLYSMGSNAISFGNMNVEYKRTFSVICGRYTK